MKPTIRALLALLTILAPIALSTGCATLQKGAQVIADTVATIQDAALILDMIEAQARTMSLVDPNQERDQAIRSAVAKARAHLNAALRAHDEAGIEAAFAKFNEVYQRELLPVAQRVGVIEQGQALPLGSAAAKAGVLVLPRPLAASPPPSR